MEQFAPDSETDRFIDINDFNLAWEQLKCSLRLEVKDRLGISVYAPQKDLHLKLLIEAITPDTVFAHTLIARHGLHLPTTAWYTSKSLPTFADALALVRSHLWARFTFQMSASDPDMINVPKRLLSRFHDLLCYAA